MELLQLKGATMQLGNILVTKFIGQASYHSRLTMKIQLLGVNTPRSKVLPFYRNQYKIMQFSLDKITMNDPETNKKIRQELNRPFILIMEYIPAIPLCQLGIQRTNRNLNPIYKHSINNLINIGRMMALDILLNNPNRFAILQQYYEQPNDLPPFSSLLFQVDINDSNLTQATFKIQSNKNINFLQIWAINITCNTLKPNHLARLKRSASNEQSLFSLNIVGKGAFEDATTYVDHIDGFLNDFFTDLRQVWELQDLDSFPFYAIRPLKQALQRYFISPNPKIWVNIMKGIVVGFYNILNAGMSILNELYYSTAALVEQDFQNIWKKGMSKIRMDFIQDVYQLISKHAQVNEDLILDILEGVDNKFILQDFNLKKNDDMLLQNLRELLPEENKNKYGRVSPSPGGKLDEVDFDEEEDQQQQEQDQKRSPSPFNQDQQELADVDSQMERQAARQAQKLKQFNQDLQQGDQEENEEDQQQQEQQPPQNNRPKKKKSKGCRVL